MEGKIITCCGDCVYYDWKKHKCKNRYNKESNAQDHFYDDCNVFKDLEEHEKEIYSKAIDDFVKFANTMPTIESEDGEIRPMWLEEMGEKLKAGANNENKNK